MARTKPSPGQRVLKLWRGLGRIPGGHRVFSLLFGFMVPYSGSIKPRFREIRPGYARISIRDRRSLRNHLKSVHALALANLGELTSGLAMLTGLQPGVRGIPVKITTTYTKKARGLLTAECSCDVPAPITEPVEFHVEATIVDSGGDEVATVTVDWLLDRER